MLSNRQTNNAGSLLLRNQQITEQLQWRQVEILNLVRTNWQDFNQRKIPIFAINMQYKYNIQYCKNVYMQMM